MPAVQETMLGAGARVPLAGSRATRERLSDATGQMLLDKHGTYKLLTFLFPTAL